MIARYGAYCARSTDAGSVHSQAVVGCQGAALTIIFACEQCRDHDRDSIVHAYRVVQLQI